MIGAFQYVPVSALEREAGVRAEWDPVSQTVDLRAGSHDLRLSPHMSVMLVDNQPHQLRHAPVMRGGELLLPEQVWTDWLSRWSTPRAAAPASPAPKLRTIVIDAGHGGHDPGATGRSGLKEKTVTLDIARRLRDLLNQEGFRTIMTRDSDRFVSLSGRSEIANRAQADLFVSIHANASRKRSASGFEVYYLSETANDMARALEAAERGELPDSIGETSADTKAIVWDMLYTEHRAGATELASAVSRSLKGSRISQNRGVKSARFAVLKGSRMPAILVEVGFITNTGEEANLRASEFRQRIAEGIRNGIVSFKNDYERRL